MSREHVKMILEYSVNLNDDLVYTDPCRVFHYLDEHCLRSHTLIRNASSVKAILRELEYEAGPPDGFQYALIMDVPSD